MNSKRSLKWIGEIAWLLLFAVGAVVLIGLFRGLAASSTVPTGAKPTLRATLIDIPTSTPWADFGQPIPTIDTNATPTPTPNSPPPTIDATFMAQVAAPTGQPSDEDIPRPTWTPLPTLSARSAHQFGVQNLQFGPAIRLSKGQYNTFGGFISWSPDGQTLAFCQQTESIKSNGVEHVPSDIALMDAHGQNVRRLVPGFDPVWSPSGNLIAYLDNSPDLHEGYIRIVDATTGQVSLVTTVKDEERYPYFAWISGTELLYYQDTLMLFDYTTGQKSDLLAGLSLPSTSSPRIYLATLPEQNLIAIAGPDIVVLKMEGSNVSVVKHNDEGLDYSTIAFSPDGTALAYLSSTRQLKILSLQDDGPLVEFPRPSNGSADSIAWSPDSASLVFSDVDGVHLVNRDGSGLRNLDMGPNQQYGYSYGLAWSSQGSLIISEQGGANSFHLFNALNSSAP